MHRPSPFTRALLAIGLLYSTAFCCGGQESRRIYSDLANGEAVLKDAVGDALRDSKRILISWGVNSSEACIALDETMLTNEKIAAVLDSDYVFIRMNSDKNLATAESLGVEIASIPTLTVVDPFEGAVAVEEFSRSTPDPAELLPFLYQWKAKPTAATKALDKARLAAERKDKAVFVLFSTSWCGYCKQLRAALSDPEVAALIDPYIDLLEIDQEAVSGGRALRYRISGRPEGGVPWYAVIGNDGTTVATSSSGLGRNIAMPRHPDSIKWFTEMIRRAAPRMTADEQTALAAAFTARAQGASSTATTEESAAKLTVR
jgi:hypothetical protein